MRQSAWIVCRLRHALCQGDVVSGFYEAPELKVGDKVFVHPEATYCLQMGRGLFRIMHVGSHHERAAPDPDHVLDKALAGIMAIRFCHSRIAMLHLLLLMAT